MRVRSADRAGVGLSMKAPVGGIDVFGLTLGTHDERGYAGVGPVIWNRAHDGKPRAAVRAVGEGVTVMAARRVEYLNRTLRARSRIRHHACMHVSRPASADMKHLGWRDIRDASAFNCIDARQWRRFAAQTPDKPIQR